jgi:hypothetical protein
MQSLQLVGLISILAIGLAGRILDQITDIELWKLVSVSLLVLVALLMVLTYLVSRVEQTSFRALFRRTQRAVAIDIRTSPARLRQRIRSTGNRR